MRKITHIIVHESDSGWGDASAINSWHLDRGWNGIGYHKVILNGKRTSKSKYKESEDGIIECGRMLHLSGAHARGYNKQSIGLCLIGKHGKFTSLQMSTLMDEIVRLMGAYDIPTSNVLGHYEIPLSGGKTCPEIDMMIFRNELQMRLDALDAMNKFGA